MDDCQIHVHGPQIVKMPKGDKKFKQFLAFKDESRQLRVLIVIYADFESIISKVKTNKHGKRKIKLENTCTVAMQHIKLCVLITTEIFQW